MPKTHLLLQDMKHTKDPPPLVKDILQNLHALLHQLKHNLSRAQ